MKYSQQVKFIALLSMASFLGIQEGQAYKIHCPKPGQLGMDAQNYFVGKTYSKHGAPINLKSTRQRQGGEYDPKNMKFWPGAFIDYNGDLRCNYVYNAEEDYGLIGADPVLANCHTHVGPAVDYVNCH